MNIHDTYNAIKTLIDEEFNENGILIDEFACDSEKVIEDIFKKIRNHQNFSNINWNEFYDFIHKKLNEYTTEVEIEHLENKKRSRYNLYNSYNPHMIKAHITAKDRDFFDQAFYISKLLFNKKIDFDVKKVNEQYKLNITVTDIFYVDLLNHLKINYTNNKKTPTNWKEVFFQLANCRDIVYDGILLPHSKLEDNYFGLRKKNILSEGFKFTELEDFEKNSIIRREMEESNVDLVSFLYKLKQSISLHKYIIQENYIIIELVNGYGAKISFRSRPQYFNLSINKNYYIYAYYKDKEYISILPYHLYILAKEYVFTIELYKNKFFYSNSISFTPIKKTMSTSSLEKQKDDDDYWYENDCDFEKEYLQDDIPTYNQIYDDNRANQLNPNNDTYYRSRGLDGKPNS